MHLSVKLGKIQNKNRCLLASLFKSELKILRLFHLHHLCLLEMGDCKGDGTGLCMIELTMSSRPLKGKLYGPKSIQLLKLGKRNRMKKRLYEKRKHDSKYRLNSYHTLNKFQHTFTVTRYIKANVIK